MISRQSPPLLRNATKATIMESTALIPAAQYVLMSTEDQQYSIANQEAVIAESLTQKASLAIPPAPTFPARTVSIARTVHGDAKTVVSSAASQIG